MEDHLVLGAVLFVIGITIVAVAYSVNSMPLLILGHILALNGAFWVVLACHKLQMLHGESPPGHEGYRPKT